MRLMSIFFSVFLLVCYLTMYYPAPLQFVSPTLAPPPGIMGQPKPINESERNTVQKLGLVRITLEKDVEDK